MRGVGYPIVCVIGGLGEPRDYIHPAYQITLSMRVQNGFEYE